MNNHVPQDVEKGFAKSAYFQRLLEHTKADSMGFEPIGDIALSPKAAAIIIGFAHKTLANWRLSGRGPPFRKINGNIRYMRSSLETWVKAHEEQRSTSDLKRIGIDP